MQILCILDSITLLKKLKSSCNTYHFKAITPDDDFDDFCNSFEPDIILFQEQYEDVSFKFLIKTLSHSQTFQKSINVLITENNKSLNPLLNYAEQYDLLLIEEDSIGPALCAKLESLYRDKHPKNNPEKQKFSNKKRVLYVSDNRFMHVIVKDACVSNSIELVDAYDTEEALIKLEEYSPDLVLTDIDIPGLSGLDLCKAIKHNRHYQDIPVVIYSSYNKEDVIDACKKVEASDYFEKNINPKDLVLHLLHHF